MQLDDYLASLRNSLDSKLKDASGNIVCPKCFKSIPSDSKFCPECGEPVSSSTKLDQKLDSVNAVLDTCLCPHCGSILSSDSAFCDKCGKPNPSKYHPDCEYDDDDYDEEENEEYGDDDYDEDDKKAREAILMTDTHILAKKYNLSRDKVRSLLQQYLTEPIEINVNWHFLDMADYTKALGEGTWMDYSEVLQKFIEDNSLAPSPSLSLFIIGGNDVIPQPAEENPCGDLNDQTQSTVYADFYYCFYGQLPLEFMDYSKARCNVARLPLESGKMNSTFENDVISYLKRRISVYDSGISIGKTVMTSFCDWIPASREMSRNLPIPHMQNRQGKVLDNMYLSPEILANMQDEKTRRQYINSLKEADMLVFNLHGDYRPQMSGFYSYDKAFSIEMLQYTHAKIFNTVACWGARYIKYRRQDSMLLSSMYNHAVMLYSGACVPALGKTGDFNCDSTWRIQPAAYSESLMARFCEYLCIGTMSAGEAFLKAKCDYYNTSRLIEDDDYILGTVLMFNLYGDPSIKTSADEAYLNSIQSRDGRKKLKTIRAPFRKMQKSIVLFNDGTQSDSSKILEMVRSSVDANLRLIHRGVSESLYRHFGLEPRDLRTVESYNKKRSDGSEESGYLYNYRCQKNDITSDYRIKVDNKGKILSAVQTK